MVATRSVGASHPRAEVAHSCIAIIGERIYAFACGLAHAAGTERAGRVTAQRPSTEEDIQGVNALGLNHVAALPVGAASTGVTVNAFTASVVAEVVFSGISAVIPELDRTGSRIAAGTAR